VWQMWTTARRLGDEISSFDLVQLPNSSGSSSSPTAQRVPTTKSKARAPRTRLHHACACTTQARASRTCLHHASTCTTHAPAPRTRARAPRKHVHYARACTTHASDSHP